MARRLHTLVYHDWTNSHFNGIFDEVAWLFAHWSKLYKSKAVNYFKLVWIGYHLYLCSIVWFTFKMKLRIVLDYFQKLKSTISTTVHDSLASIHLQIEAAWSLAFFHSLRPFLQKHSIIIMKLKRYQLKSGVNAGCSKHQFLGTTY